MGESPRNGTPKRTLVAKQELKAVLDLKPALSEEQLDQRILREFDANHNKSFKNVIGSLFPAKLTPVMIGLSGIDPDKKVHDISREERQGFASFTMKSLIFGSTSHG